MKCKKCDIEMKQVGTEAGDPYYKCEKCGNGRVATPFDFISIQGSGMGLTGKAFNDFCNQKTKCPKCGHEFSRW